MWILIAAGALLGAVLPQVQAAAPPADAVALAVQLARTSDPSAREALLARHSALVDTPLLRALIEQARARIDAAEYDAATSIYLLTIDLATTLDNRTNLAAALIGLGSVHGRQGDYPAADERLRAGLRIAEAIDDVVRIDAALHNLGIVHRLQGNYEDALAYYEQVVALAERTDRAHVLGPTYNNIGVVHMLRGHYRDALAALQRALALKEAAGDTAGLGSTLTNIGDVHVQQGHPELALQYYRRSLDLAEQLKQPARRANTFNDIGNALAALGRHDAALAEFERALALHDEAGRRAESAATLYSMGRSLDATGDRKAAADRHARSLAIREAINDRPGMAESWIALGELALTGADPAGALELADRASRLAAEIGARESFWRGRLVAGRAHEARGSVAPAETAYRDAIDAIETLRADVAGSVRDRQRYFETRLAPFHRLAALLIAAGRTADALDVAERARARVLYDVLRGGPAERRRLTAADRERQRTIERRLADARARLWAEQSQPQPDPMAIRRLRADVESARLAHEDLRASLYAAHPTLHVGRGDSSAGPVDLSVALIEDDNSALIEFLVTSDATWLFVLTRGTPDRPGTAVRSFRLGITRDRLASLVERFRRQLESRDLGFVPTSRELFDLVLGPADAVLRDKTTLIVVPDAELWALPFHALRDPSGRYLIERASVSLAPSIAALAEIRARRGAASSDGPRLLAFGDPLSAESVASSTAAASGLAPLPDAVRQVRALSDLYGDGRSDVFTGATALEAVLRETRASPTVLHFATHGLADDASPMYSWLLLAGTPDGGAGGDGRLEAWEVADLRLPVDAVVLAACETALGRVGPGEGMIGLSWAFLLAGSPRTIVSLWRVDAASTTDLMLAFHRRFRDGSSRDSIRPGAAESVRDAALTLLRSERYRHPFYWAGFVVVGDGR